MDQDILNILNEIDCKIENFEELQKNLNDLKEQTEQTYKEILSTKQMVENYLKNSENMLKNS